MLQYLMLMMQAFKNKMLNLLNKLKAKIMSLIQRKAKSQAKS